MAHPMLTPAHVEEHDNGATVTEHNGKTVASIRRGLHKNLDPFCEIIFSERAIIAALAEKISAAGFRTFIAESGTYGFYTDKEGARVVSFSLDFGSPKFAGNHVSKEPRSHGQGWVMESGVSFADMLAADTPQWAGGGACRPKTLAEYQADYQSSSRFTETEGN